MSRSGHDVVLLEDFSGGLNLASGPLDSRYAIDCQDVLYGRAVRTRSGWDYLTSAATSYTLVKPFAKTDGTKRLLAARGGNTDAVNSAGTVTDTTAKTFTDATMFGGPTAEAAYLANGSDTVFKYTGSAFSSPANMPKAKYLCVQSPDNRLVATGFSDGSNGPSGATVNTSHVHFSDERAPETWTAGSNVQLTPGDGETIQGCAAWRNLVVVFKQTKFFIFTGNSIDEDGNPLFNRETRVGAGLCAPQAYAASNDGLYFLDRTGVYVTNGGNAQKVSDQLDPIFEDEAPQFFSHGVVNQSAISGASMAYWNERLYVSVPMNGSTTNNRILVFDPKRGYWSVYSIPAASLCVWSPTDAPVLGFAHSTEKLASHSTSSDDDAGSPINSFTRTAWIDKRRTCTIRRARLWGAGRITTSAAVDYTASLGNGVVAELTSNAEEWSDGTEPTDLWADGSDLTDRWGATSAYTSAWVSGFGVRGSVFSITFQGGGTSPLVLEKASFAFSGGRRSE